MAYFNNNDNNLSDYEKDLLMYHKFSACNCCERHITDRPVYMKIGWKPNWINISEKHIECLCPCRHSMRFLARIYNLDVSNLDVSNIRKLVAEKLTHLSDNNNNNNNNNNTNDLSDSSQ